NRGLRRTIVRMTGPGTQTAQRAQVDDLSPPLPQMLQSLARDQERAARVGGKYCVPLLQCDLVELDGLIVGGVVDQNIDSAQLLHGFPDCGPDALFLGDVAPQGHGTDSEAAQVDDGMLGLARGVAKSDGHIGPCLSQFEPDGPAQAARSAGNQGSLS